MTWITLIEHNPILLFGVTALFALIVGSFLNVVIYRLPKMIDRDWRRECAALTGGNQDAATKDVRLTLARPGSHCRHCGHRVRALENIPLLSYLVLRGRCAACGGKIVAKL